MPLLYVLNFTSNPPLSCCHFLRPPLQPPAPLQVIIAQPLKIVRLSKSTLPPDEDQRCAVEIHIIQDEQYVSWHTQQVALNQSHYCITCEKPGEDFKISINPEFLAICSKSFRTNDTAECILAVYLLPTYKQTNKLNIIHHYFNFSLILFGSCSRSVSCVQWWHGLTRSYITTSQSTNFYSDWEQKVY